MSARHGRVEWKGRETGPLKDRGGVWSIWTPLARFPCPLQRQDLTSHAIRSSVNQQLGVQMKKCQLLPGATTDQENLHSSTEGSLVSQSRNPPTHSPTEVETHTHKLRACLTDIRQPTLVSTHSSIEPSLNCSGKRMALSHISQLDKLLYFKARMTTVPCGTSRLSLKHCVQQTK